MDVRDDVGFRMHLSVSNLAISMPGALNFSGHLSPDPNPETRTQVPSRSSVKDPTEQGQQCDYLENLQCKHS